MSASTGVAGISVTPDLTIIFGSDGTEWSDYLSECFSNAITIQSKSGPSGLFIVQERLEEMSFPVPLLKKHCFTDAGAVLLIISPDFLDFVEVHPEVYEFGCLLDPRKTVGMLCGVDSRDVTAFHKAALVTYDQWPCLVAKDQDKDFVLCLIQKISDILAQRNSPLKLDSASGQVRSSNCRLGIFSIAEGRSPQFKLTPRKVKEGSGKVFVLLNETLKEKQKAHVFLEFTHKDGSSHIKEMSVKQRNPYTVQITVPDKYLRVSRILNVTVYLDGDNQLLGSRPLKCESRMSELYALLSTVNAPFEFLSQILGLATLSEVDAELTKRFVQNLPKSGFSLLASSSGKDQMERKRSDIELPTLLHFAARYGLRQLTKQLLQCPEALSACKMKNCRGLTPAHLASQYGHKEIVASVEEFVNIETSTTSKMNFLYLNTTSLKELQSERRVGSCSTKPSETSEDTDYGSSQTTPAEDFDDEFDYMELKWAKRNDSNNNNNSHSQSDQQDDYDRVPSGPPIPVFKKPPKTSQAATAARASNSSIDFDYDVPKGLQQFRKNLKKLGTYQNCISKV